MIDNPNIKLQNYLSKMRENADSAPSFDEIAEIVQQVR